MGEQKIIELLDLCDQLEKLRNIERTFSHYRHIFRDLGFDIRHLDELNEDTCDEVIGRMSEEVQKVKEGLFKRVTVKREEATIHE